MIAVWWTHGGQSNDILVIYCYIRFFKKIHLWRLYYEYLPKCPNPITCSFEIHFHWVFHNHLSCPQGWADSPWWCGRPSRRWKLCLRAVGRNCEYVKASWLYLKMDLDSQKIKLFSENYFKFQQCWINTLSSISQMITFLPENGYLLDDLGIIWHDLKSTWINFKHINSQVQIPISSFKITLAPWSHVYKNYIYLCLIIRIK